MDGHDCLFVNGRRAGMRFTNDCPLAIGPLSQDFRYGNLRLIRAITCGARIDLHEFFRRYFSLLPAVRALIHELRHTNTFVRVVCSCIA